MKTEQKEHYTSYRPDGLIRGGSTTLTLAEIESVLDMRYAAHRAALAVAKELPLVRRVIVHRATQCNLPNGAQYDSDVELDWGGGDAIYLRGGHKLAFDHEWRTPNVGSEIPAPRQ